MIHIEDKIVIVKIVENTNAIEFCRALQVGDELLLTSELADDNIYIDDDYDSDNGRAIIVDTSLQPVAWFDGDFGDQVSQDLSNEDVHYRAFLAKPKTNQKLGTFRVRIVGGNATSDEVAAWLNGKRPPKAKPARVRKSWKSKRGREYDRLQLTHVYRNYATLKGWNTSQAVVDDKVDSWLESSLGAVGLAVEWLESGIDPKPELSRH